MFRDDFIWGVADASYQVEGGRYDRGDSIWDEFCHTPGRCFLNHNGDIACDRYNRYKEDIALMKELGVKAHRLSISWPRVLPDGVGKINQKGVDFYNNVINELLKNGIEPLVTLFHWDYPLSLEKRGGWSNPESPKWFEEYSSVVFKLFGDRVKKFITFNEPQCFIGLGYISGSKAPGKKLPPEVTVPMSHNVMLAHGLAVRAFRKLVPDGKISYAPTMEAAIPFTDSPEDIAAAKKFYFNVSPETYYWSVSWWSDPVIFGRYPEETEAFKLYEKYLPENYKGDLKIISEPIDFYCQNIYHGLLLKADENGEPCVAERPLGYPRTAIDWPIVPEALYWAPKFLYERYKLPILISENGISCCDREFLDGYVHDPERTDFLVRYLKNLKDTVRDGTDIVGYIHWSFSDNFEWETGFSQRFGLVFVDFETQKRIKKDSFYSYKEIILSNGKNL